MKKKNEININNSSADLSSAYIVCARFLIVLIFVVVIAPMRTSNSQWRSHNGMGYVVDAKTSCGCLSDGHWKKNMSKSENTRTFVWLKVVVFFALLSNEMEKFSNAIYVKFYCCCCYGYFYDVERYGSCHMVISHTIDQRNRTLFFLPC